MANGKRLREIRQQRGLSCNVLARMAGCSVNTILIYENWGLPPRQRETRERIARVLKVDPDWLFEIEEKAEG
jgi:transcriptional regulator with XRE-family HTH domain